MQLKAEQATVPTQQSTGQFQRWQRQTFAHKHVISKWIMRTNKIYICGKLVRDCGRTRKAGKESASSAQVAATAGASRQTNCAHFSEWALSPTPSLCVCLPARWQLHCQTLLIKIEVKSCSQVAAPTNFCSLLRHLLDFLRLKEGSPRTLDVMNPKTPLQLSIVCLFVCLSVLLVPLCICVCCGRSWHCGVATGRRVLSGVHAAYAWFYLAQLHSYLKIYNAWLRNVNYGITRNNFSFRCRDGIDRRSEVLKRGTKKGGSGFTFHLIF